MLEILAGSRGEPGLRMQGQLVHDPERPREEALEMVAGLKAGDADLILIFGLGLGYHLDELARTFPDARLMVFDPETEIQRAWVDLGIHKTFLSDARVFPDLISDWAELNRFLTEHVVHGEYPWPQVLVLPGYRKAVPQKVEDFLGVVRGARLRRAVNDKTMAEKGRLFLENLAGNISALVQCPRITDLKDRFAGRAGFIVGSGPSLEDEGPLLARLRHGGLILAAASAVGPLIQMGVEPDLVVVIEAEDTSDYLDKFGSDRIALAAASASHPHHFKIPGLCPTLFHPTWALADLVGETEFVPQAGTSGSAAFTLGLIMGLNPLVLIGQDQAVGERLHALGTPGEVELQEDMTSWTVEGAGGGLVRTHSGFAASLHWFAESARYLSRTDPGRIVVNASGRGAHIPGVSDVGLKDIPHGGRKKTWPGIMNRIIGRLAPPKPSRLKVGLENSARLLARAGQILRLNPEPAMAELIRLRKDHPLLKMTLAGLNRKSPPVEAKIRLEEMESRVLGLLAALAREVS